MPGSPRIFAAVEGIVDEAVARRLIKEAGGIPGTVYAKVKTPYARRSKALTTLPNVNLGWCWWTWMPTPAVRQVCDKPGCPCQLHGSASESLCVKWKPG